MVSLVTQCAAHFLAYADLPLASCLFLSSKRNVQVKALFMMYCLLSDVFLASRASISAMPLSVGILALNFVLDSDFLDSLLKLLKSHLSLLYVVSSIAV